MKTRFCIILLMLFIGQSVYAVETGSTAPNFKLMNSNGELVELADFKGKTVVLEWLNHECPYVERHYSTGNMQKTQGVAKEKGAVWLSVVSSAPGKQGYVEGPKANELTEKTKAVPTAVLLDPEGSVGKSYSAKTTPHMYIVDETGKLVYQGGIDDAGGMRFFFRDLGAANNYVIKALDQIAKGETITDATTTPYGCSVKYKS